MPLFCYAAPSQSHLYNFMYVRSRTSTHCREKSVSRPTCPSAQRFGYDPGSRQRRGNSTREDMRGWIVSVAVLSSCASMCFNCVPLQTQRRCLRLLLSRAYLLCMYSHNATTAQAHRSQSLQDVPHSAMTTEVCYIWPVTLDGFKSWNSLGSHANARR